MKIQSCPWGNDLNPQRILLGKPVTPQGQENQPNWSWFVQQQLEKTHGEKKNKKPNFIKLWKCKKLEGKKHQNFWDLRRHPRGDEQSFWGLCAQTLLVGKLESSRMFQKPKTPQAWDAAIPASSKRSKE